MRHFKQGGVKQSLFRRVIGQPNRYRRSMQLQFFGIVISLLLISPVREFYLLSRELDFRIEPTYAKEVEVKPDFATYAFEQAKKAGLNPVDVLRIIQCESGFNPNALNGNKNGSVDVGIAQWNLKSHPHIKIETALDPYQSIDLMIKERLHDKNWSAWMCAKKLGIR
jgi:soluble lytic murein transglycosylase-like protein